MADGERDTPEDKSSPLILSSWLDWQKSSPGVNQYLSSSYKASFIYVSHPHFG